MRPLVFAAALLALAGCSLPYEGTSFAALPKPEHMAEGEHHETENHATQGGEGHVENALATRIYSPDGDDAPFEMGDVERMDRSGAVFPKTAPPSPNRVVSGRGYRTDAMPAAQSAEGAHE